MTIFMKPHNLTHDRSIPKSSYDASENAIVAHYRNLDVKITSTIAEPSITIIVEHGGSLVDYSPFVRRVANPL